MKVRIVFWILLAILAGWLVTGLLAAHGAVVGLGLFPMLASLAFLVFWGGLLVIHIASAIYILEDAHRRDGLFLEIPAWIWGVMGGVTGMFGLAFYWLANCSRFVRDQTLPLDGPSDL